MEENENVGTPVRDTPRSNIRVVLAGSLACPRPHSISGGSVIPYLQKAVALSRASRQ